MSEEYLDDLDVSFISFFRSCYRDDVDYLISIEEYSEYRITFDHFDSEIVEEIIIHFK